MKDNLGKQTFNRFRTPFLDIGIISEVVVFWFLGGVILYNGHAQEHSYPMIFIYALAAYFIIGAAGLRYIYYRWLLFRYDESTTLSIDSENGIFTYKHGDRTIVFTSDDIEKWWHYQCGPQFAVFIEVIEIYLKTGERIVLSNALWDAVIYVYKNAKQLGLPEEYGERKDRKYQSLKDYIESIE